MNAFKYDGLKGKPFVAVSIDLCGSTMVKQRIVELARGDRAAQERMYGAYKKLLFDIERTFYFLVLEETELDFERLTLIKSIGDELWYAYAIDEMRTEDEVNAVRRLLVNLLHLISSSRMLTLVREEDDRSNIGSRFEVPIKVYADLIQQCEELNSERYEHLKETIAASRGNSSTVIDLDEGYMETCRRLKLGLTQSRDGQGVEARQDFIGLEIDRFFRLTKQCHPRLLTIGQNLFDYLGCTLTALSTDFEHLDLKVIDLECDPGLWGHAVERVFAIRHPVASTEMKGVSDEYAVMHLFDLPSLGDHFAAPSPLVESLMDETRGYLAAKGFFAVVNETRSAAL